MHQGHEPTKPFASSTTSRALLRRALVAALFGSLGPLASGCDGFYGDGPLDTGSEDHCTQSEFRVGEPSYLTDDPRLGALLHIVSGLRGVGLGMVDEVAIRCGAIAEGLDASRAERDAAAANVEAQVRMAAQCSLAATAIRTARAQAGGTYSLVLEDPICGASVPDYATCQKTCSADPACDPLGTPISCDGGALVIACQGACSDPAGLEVSCRGRCDGTCAGACVSESGVACAGPCRGTCRGEADGGVGEGIRDDGTCHGLCEGTCEATEIDATCDGACDGACSTTCRADGTAATCDGSCDGASEVLRCEGGALGGGCALDPACAAACHTDARAGATCTAPAVAVVVTEPTNPQLAAKLRAVLEANLGAIATSHARATGIAETSDAMLSAVNADTFADVKVPCIAEIIAALYVGLDDVELAGQSTGDLLFEAR